MNSPPEKVVFDCNIFAQPMMNPNGPAGACVQAALDQKVQLVLSNFVIQEIKEIPDKVTPNRAGVTPQKVESLILLLLDCAELIAARPALFAHPIDEDDSEYVNLAIAAQAKLIVSRDRHLLNLTNPTKPWSSYFRRSYPTIQIMSPETLLESLRSC